MRTPVALVGVVTGALIWFAPAALAEPPAPPAPIIPPPVQPANIGDLKFEATDYYDSGAYLTDLQLAAAPAIAWITEEAPRVDRPAVVFDIDETALSNWEAIKANDFGRVSRRAVRPAARRAVRLARLGPSGAVDGDPADDGHLHHRQGSRRGDLLHHRSRRDSARGDRTQPAGRRLHRLHELIMEPPGAHYVSAADFKAPQRAQIEQQGYTIIANVGDQPSDLDGGFSERTYLLPDPFYRIP